MCARIPRLGMHKLRTGDPMPAKSARKPGRPATGRDESIAVRLPAHVLEEIDTWRSRYAGMSRATAYRCLLVLGLKAPASAEVRDPKDAAGFWVPGRIYRARDEGR